MPSFFSNNASSDHRREVVRNFELRLEREEYVYMDLQETELIFEYYLENGRYDRAEEVVTYARTWHTEHPELDFLAARLSAERQDFYVARDLLDRALNANPGQSEYLMLKAVVLAHLEEYAASITLLETLRYRGVDAGEVLLQLGYVGQLARHFQASEQYYREALQLIPNLEEAAYELALLLQELERSEEAEKVLTQFLEHNPESHFIWYSLGLTRIGDDRYEAALEAFERACEIEPNMGAAHFQRGKAYSQLGNFYPALRAFLEAAWHQPDDAPTTYSIADTFEHLQDFRGAIRYYYKTLELEPDYEEVYAGLGFCLEQKSDFRGAVHYYEKAVAADPEDGESLFALATCEYRLGNTRAGWEHLSQALPQQPDNAEIWWEWAELVAEHEDMFAALTFLQRGVREMPHLAAYLNAYSGVLSFRNGHVDAALKFFRPAVERDPRVREEIVQLAPDVRNDRRFREVLGGDN